MTNPVTNPAGPNGPTWYDLLDVAPDAETAQIRVAWRQAIAELEPTDRRFRTLNDAAEVLLDDARRAAYDAEIAPPTPAPEPADAGTENDKATEAEIEDEIEDAPDAPAEPAARWNPPTWLIAGLGVAAVVLVAAAALAWLRPHDPVLTVQSEDGSGLVEESAEDARQAAAEAVVPVLSYDYRHLDADAKDAEARLTEDYRQQYDQLFDVIKTNAPDTKSVVTASVVDSGVVRTSADGDRVQVLLFVDRPTRNARQSDPVVYSDQVTVTMKQVEGDWLVDDMVTGAEDAA